MNNQEFRYLLRQIKEKLDPDDIVPLLDVDIYELLQYLRPLIRKKADRFYFLMYDEDKDFI